LKADERGVSPLIAVTRRSPACRHAAGFRHHLLLGLGA
jgi:hypothetical protein